MFYIGYQLYNANYSSVKTEVAEYVSADDPGTAVVVQVDGLILRKEKVLSQEVNGVGRLCGRGWRANPEDGVVGEVFSSQSDAAAQQQIEILDEQIADLERLGSSGNVHNSDQGTLKSQSAIEAGGRFESFPFRRFFRLCRKAGKSSSIP